MLSAVRDKRAVHIEYQSMSSDQPDPVWRWISPHAFGYDGMRWHVRAFCHRSYVFKDFLLGRCLAAAELAPASPQAGIDLLWEKIFKVVLEPNPGLSEGQRRSIALDYGMTDNKAVVPVRYALLYYFNKRMRLDVSAKLDRPRERPVVVFNRTEFEKALAVADARPKAAVDLTANPF